MIGGDTPTGAPPGRNEPQRGAARIEPGGREAIGIVNALLARVLGIAAGTGPPNLFTTLGRHRALLRRWLWFAGGLMPGGRLPRSDTELVILRVAHRARCAYEWRHHARIARRAGIDRAGVERVRQGPDAPGWSPRQRLLLAATDELLDARAIGDDTWAELARLLTDEELIELCMLVGHYEMLAMTINTLRIQPDEPRRARGRRGLGPVTVLVALGAMAGAPTTGPASASTGDSTLRISASPALEPGFQPGAHDYVSRCHRRRLRVTVAAPAGNSASIDGHRLPSGMTSRRLHKATDESTVVSVRNGKRTDSYHIRCLPPAFPSWRVRVAGRPRAGWYVASPSPYDVRGYVTIFDRHGAPVWWMPGGNRGVTVIPPDRIAFVCCMVWADPFTVWRFDGTPVGTVAATGPGIQTDDHDLDQLPNGDFLVLGTQERSGIDLSRFGGPRSATVVDGVVQEVAPDGRVVWSWTTAGHIPLSATGRWYRLQVLHMQVLRDYEWGYDLVHLNSVEPYGSDILISSRHTDAIYAVDRSTGAIDWKLGGTRTSRSLKVVGDPHPRELFGGQHDARVLPDGTITVHDNGTGLHRHPRALRIAIDAVHRQASVLEVVPALRFHGISWCCGSARRLPGGHWVISWGGRSRFAEVTPSGRPVVEFDLDPGESSFRVLPIPAGQLSAARLRAGMDAIASARLRGRAAP
ncbi:MAG: aryl-sulfate sulfotransferase [Actinobacteria bacterium]|nr:aryl-sulfate sulfotransferase [Actinomycetota bacterium]